MRRAFVLTARVFFIALMLASATGKLLNMPGFYDIVRNYHMVPEPLLIPSAWALTLFELALGVTLVSTAWRQVVWCLVPLHLFYLAGLSQALLRGLHLSNCGCFGVYWARPLTPYSIVEDLVLLSLAVLFYRLSRSPMNHGQTA